MARPICPNCEEVDAVQKASAVYNNGTHATRYNIPVVYGSGKDQYTMIEEHTATSQTSSAAKLAPPPKPSAGISLIGWGIVCALLSFIIGIYATTWIYKGVYTIIPVEKFWLPMLAVFVIGLVGAAIWNQHQVKEAAKALPGWQYAIGRWNALFYCVRCDGVFIPENNSFAPANQIRKYLYHGDADFCGFSGHCQGDMQVSWQPPALTAPAPLDVRITPAITGESLRIESDDDYYDRMAERHGYEG